MTIEPFYKVDARGYVNIHAWVKRRLTKPNQCSLCLEVKRLDLANISQKYLRDLADWEWLCRRCHMKKDGRIVRINNTKKELKSRMVITLEIPKKSVLRTFEIEPDLYAAFQAKVKKQDTTASRQIRKMIKDYLKK